MHQFAGIVLLLSSAIVGACPLEGVWEVDVIRSAANYVDDRDIIGEWEEAHISALTSVQWEFTCNMFITRSRRQESEAFQFSSERSYTWLETGAAEIAILHMNHDGIERSFSVKLVEEGCFSYYHPREFYDQVWCRSK